MLLFYQVATRLSLTTCQQVVELQDDNKLLKQHCYKSAAGLLQLVRFYVCSRDKPKIYKPFDYCIWYPDILPKDTLPKDLLPNGHFAERTFCRTDVLPNGHFAEWTTCRMDNLPKIKILFRQNVWACDSFLNCVILNHCVK